MKLGVIGLSPGNGHPYSWSAIFNGFTEKYMKACPFPSIPEYLAKHKFPEEFLHHIATVSHIWCQEKQLAEAVARASNIEHVVSKAEDMIGNIDALLLARDDAENHPAMAIPFLKAGVPVFVDKPFALSTADARLMLDERKASWHVFSCSSLRFAMELQLTGTEKNYLGNIERVDGTVMKSWNTYGIHILEPVLVQFPNRGKLLKVRPEKREEMHVVEVEWQHLLARFKVTGNTISPIQLKFHGPDSSVVKQFEDSFSCFKASLLAFVQQVIKQQLYISDAELMELTEIIEKGKC